MKKINKDSFSYQLVKITYITAGCANTIHALDAAVAPIFKSSAVQNRHWAVVLGLTGTYIAAQCCVFYTLGSYMNDGIDDLIDEWNRSVDYDEHIKNLHETEDSH